MRIVVGLQESDGALSDQRLTIIVLSNFGVRPGNFGHKILWIYLADQIFLPTAVKVEPEALRKYVGRYMLCEWVPAGATDCGGRLDPEAYFDVTLEREALWVKPANREKVRLMPESEMKFFVHGVEDARFTFNKNVRGDVISLYRWHRFVGRWRSECLEKKKVGPLHSPGARSAITSRLGPTASL